MMQFLETLHENYGQLFTVDRVVYRETTAHQDLVIFDNAIFGRVLALDGAIQTTERDNHIYHEMLVHVPVLAHGDARNVLIVGGGDGGCLREVVRHPIDAVTMVDLDRKVIDLTIEHMPSLSDGAFDDPRLDLVIADGKAYVSETDQRFDVIVVDSTDPVGPGLALYSPDFYAGCKRCLRDGGVIVTQNGMPLVQPDEVRDSYQALSALFGDVSFYLVPVPSYTGGALAVGWATDNAALRQLAATTIAKRYEATGLNTRYYSPDIHTAAFALPPEMSAMLAR